ncbi:MAG: response regulator [Pyrinomonadaceae bacterium]
MKRARVVLADDHTILLEALKSILEPEVDVVGTVSDGRSLLKTALELKPDVIVLDISMPLLNGLDAGRLIRDSVPHVKLIYLTMNQDADVAAEAFRLGASGYLLKTSAASELLQAIREALLGRSYVTSQITEGMIGVLIQRPVHRGGSKLTLRQREVLQLLAEGRSMKEVANVLSIAARTVAFHKYQMMEQLQLKTSAQLIQFAVREHLIAA